MKEDLAGTLLPESVEQEHWTARFGKPIVFFVATLILAGAYLAGNIPVSVFPSTDFPRIVVGIDNGVMPIEQMQILVTRPVEEALNAVPGLTQVRSLTSRGSAEIDLFFDWSVNMFQTLDLVNAALARVQGQLPSTAAITANRLTFAAFPILGYSLVSDTIPQTTLWELATYAIKPRLNRLSGVSTVIVQGGQEPEFQIQPDPAKLLVTQVTVPDIIDAVAKNNILDSPGLFNDRHELVLGIVSGQATTPDQIGDIPVRITPSGTPLHIADIARVTPSVKPVHTVVTAEGKPAVLLNISRQPTSNTVAVATEVKKELDALRPTLPQSIRIAPFYDQSNLVRASITSVRDAILIGLVLAAIVLVALSARLGHVLWWPAWSFRPLSRSPALCFTLSGQSFNLMTLGGLAAAVGLVIDDAIVVVENIVASPRNSADPAEAIRSALEEIRVPLVGSTVTPIVVFLPLDQHHWSYGHVLSSSCINGGCRAAYFTRPRADLDTRSQPLPSAFGLSGPRRGTHGSGLMGRVIGVYNRAINIVLKAPLVLVLASLALIVASYFCYRASVPICCRLWTKVVSSSTT